MLLRNNYNLQKKSTPKSDVVLEMIRKKSGDRAWSEMKQQRSLFFTAYFSIHGPWPKLSALLFADVRDEPAPACLYGTPVFLSRELGFDWGSAALSLSHILFPKRFSSMGCKDQTCQEGVY